MLDAMWTYPNLICMLLPFDTQHIVARLHDLGQAHIGAVHVIWLVFASYGRPNQLAGTFLGCARQGFLHEVVHDFAEARPVSTEAGVAVAWVDCVDDDFALREWQALREGAGKKDVKDCGVRNV